MKLYPHSNEEKFFNYGKGVKTMYVYKSTEPGLWTVGFYDPNGVEITYSAPGTEIAEIIKHTMVFGKVLRITVETEPDA